jgi:hypothetical protein
MKSRVMQKRIFITLSVKTKSNVMLILLMILLNKFIYSLSLNRLRFVFGFSASPLLSKPSSAKYRNEGISLTPRSHIETA